jgi:hypothetical protein
MASKLMLGGLWLALFYLWVVPVFQPRGHYFGRYAWLDLAAGIPLTAVALWAGVGYLLPRSRRRAFALASLAFLLPAGALFLAMDAFYALVVLGAWERNYWLDRGHISRAHNKPHRELGFVRAGGISWRGDGRTDEYRTDRYGFRNAPGLTRADVVFIGDSYTEAAETPEKDTFPGRVAGITGLTAANLGRGAYGPQQELIVLKRYGLKFSPRLVVWQVFDGNDLLDAAEFERWKEDPDSGGVSLFRRYFSNSLTRNWLKKTLGLPFFSGPKATLRYKDGGAKSLSIRYHERQFARRGDPALAAAERAIEEGYRICSKRGIDFLVIFIPTMLRVLEPYIEFEREEDGAAYTVSEDGPDFESATAEFCRRTGFAYMNLEPALRAAAEAGERDLFIPSDEHLAPGGHEVVAREIAAWIQARLERGAGDSAAE